ncbi:hypothetical protein [Streptomyces sp. NRRL F-5135]|uniref:hypothetical protein n=1 Tax=Streptomyces sp. NRRL F-5135 TaxID=1463858 RepID=UPI000A6A214A|nr:hypothetical protein [Streptomyces sp. NRRL F-5135]
MLATQERVREGDRTIIIWHKAAEPEQCNGGCDWHPIACSTTEGITTPGSLREIPIDLAEVPLERTAEAQRWCSNCLAVHGTSTEK